VTFDGFGEYFLEFTVYYWIKENYLVTKSKIAVNVYDILVENNIKMPRQIGDFNVNLNGNENSDKIEPNNISKNETDKNTLDENPKE
jgi:small-conductance mechanosensitive channel